MKTKYIATFADGSSLTRSTDRTYGAAYRVTFLVKNYTQNETTGKWSPDGTTYRCAPQTGFAASVALADKAARAKVSFSKGTEAHVEIVPARKIVRAEGADFVEIDGRLVQLNTAKE